MPTQSLFNISPYYDDYNEDKNFLRMLFRPGYAVQARELTQAQTILQNQIERFGNHVFEDGARVLGAGVTTRPTSFVRTYTDYTSNDGDVTEIDFSKLIGYDLTGTGADGLTARAKVIHAITGDIAGEDNFNILFLEFVRGSSFTAGSILDSSYPSEIYKVQSATAGAAIGFPDHGEWADGVYGADLNGEAQLVSVDEGVFFVDGFFVKSQKSHNVPYSYGLTGTNQRYFKNPNARVGFDVNRRNTTSTDDNSLKDPASGSYNFNAPGADRYSVKLNLGFKDGFPDISENFIELLRFQEGEVTYKIIKTNYSELEKTLAIRTYDESGSYTVRPFEIDMREHLKDGDNRGIYSSTTQDPQGVCGDATKLAVGLQQGKGYVFGHEYETQTTEYVTIDKARSTALHTGTTFDATHGNWYSCFYPPTNQKGLGWLFGRGDINKSPMEVALTSPAQVAIATAKIHKVEMDQWRYNTGDTFRVFLYDIKLVEGTTKKLSEVSQIYIYSGETGTIPVSSKLFNISGPSSIGLYGTTGPHERDSNLLLFPVGVGSAVKNYNKLKYSFKKTFRLAVTGGTDLDNYTVDVGEADSSDGYATFKFDTDENNPVKYNLFVADNPGGESDPIADTVIIPDATFSVNGRVLTLGNMPASVSDGNELLLQATVVYNDTDGNHTHSRRNKRLLQKSLATVITRKESPDGQIYFELPDADVHEIRVVAGVTSGADFDPSEDFLFDNGQRDNEYLPARLWVKENKKNVYTLEDGGHSGGFEYRASYFYFQHEEGPGPFTVDSYTANGFTYDNIPLYTSNNLKKTYSLANVLDFRHTNPQFPDDPIAWKSFDITNTSRIPDTDVPFGESQHRIEENHEYYISRIDKIAIKNALNGDVSFDVIKGTDALVPKTPLDNENSMTLYTLTVPAYTHNPDDVGIKYVENKRYTMKDLGKVENRVNDLEYFTTLSLLENEIDARVINSSGSSSDSAFKNGILVDEFKGHRVGDVSHVDYNCSVDYQKGHLRPAFVPVNLGLTLGQLPTNLEMSSDGLITFRVDGTNSQIYQPLISTTVSVNPFNLSNWLGTVSMDSPTITWFDTSVRPTVKVNSQGENDNWKVSTVNNLRGFGTQWNDWNANWYGVDIIKDDFSDRIGKSFLSQARVKDMGVPVVRDKNETNISSVTRDIETTRKQKSRLGFSINVLPDHIQKTIGDSVVDVSVVPFIESQTTGITLNAYGLKPNTSVNCFFDDLNVNDSCGNTSGVSGPFTTDANGKLTDINFVLPSSTFQTGEKVFRFVDDSEGNLAYATTSADGILYAQGLVRKRDGNVVSTRPPILRRQTVKSEQIIKNPYMRKTSMDISKYTNWLDPLSQIFYIDEVANPEGVFLNSLDLYFSEIDNDIPVKVDIRPTINGIPSPSMIVPFSEVWKQGITHGNSTLENNETFTFSSPVYLQPGEYAISIQSNSGNYKLHAGEIGEDDINGSERISFPMDSGPLFRPTNSREAEPDPTMNIKYKLWTCLFDGTNENKTISVQHNTLANDVYIDEYQLNHSTVIPSGTSIINSASFDSDIVIIPGKSVVPSSRTKIIAADPITEKFQITLSRDNSVSQTSISPILDTKYLDFVCIENKINNKLSSSDGSDNDETKPFGSDLGAIAKYITRRVTLEDDFEAKNLKVFLDLNQQGAGGSDVNIEVYAKFVSETEDADFGDKSYVKMNVENNEDQFVSENEFDFREVSYTLPTDSIPLQDADRIKSFAIKICMYRNDSDFVTSVPKIKDLRVVALDS